MSWFGRTPWTLASSLIRSAAAGPAPQARPRPIAAAASMRRRPRRTQRVMRRRKSANMSGYPVSSDRQPAQEEPRQPADGLRPVDVAAATKLDPRVRHLVRRHPVVGLDALRRDDARKAQHIHVLVHPDLLLPGHQEVAV